MNKKDVYGWLAAVLRWNRVAVRARGRRVERNAADGIDAFSSLLAHIGEGASANLDLRVDANRYQVYRCALKSFDGIDESRSFETLRPLYESLREETDPWLVRAVAIDVISGPTEDPAPWARLVIPSHRKELRLRANEVAYLRALHDSNDAESIARDVARLTDWGQAAAAANNPRSVVLEALAEHGRVADVRAVARNRLHDLSHHRDAPSRELLWVELAVGQDISDEDGTIFVWASSNLPEGTELHASVSAEGAFHAHASTALHAGAAEFGPFSDNGGPLPHGVYNVTVTMVSARSQPDRVRTVIGDEGEYLAGPLVGRDGATAQVVVQVSHRLVNE
ncbi:hypothetical protein [Cellulomonas edaphi]|uniref:Uncharacterized protein n=1 Tax=Cellulomonas edaphi TaxID=3053468 RepID=A0ABT7S4X4_9CELL|nr:hypothetical protein [Cellulomons edaphi]MDM7830671.1 hypothetical protein [Cellulomons edaphi]